MCVRAWPVASSRSSLILLSCPLVGVRSRERRRGSRSQHLSLHTRTRAIGTSHLVPSERKFPPPANPQAFQGRHGRAYLFNDAVNVTLGPSEDRMLITGLHTVADIFCTCCNTNLGWKYEQAYEDSQKYKEGKYIIEKARVMKVRDWGAVCCWAGAAAAAAATRARVFSFCPQLNYAAAHTHKTNTHQRRRAAGDAARARKESLPLVCTSFFCSKICWFFLFDARPKRRSWRDGARRATCAAAARQIPQPQQRPPVACGRCCCPFFCLHECVSVFLSFRVLFLLDISRAFCSFSSTRVSPSHQVCTPNTGLCFACSRARAFRPILTSSGNARRAGKAAAHNLHHKPSLFFPQLLFDV